MEIICLKSKFLRNIFDQNTYVVKGENTAIIIDAGAEIEDVLKEVEGFRVAAILITHIHFDHIWNIEKYIEQFGCKIFICKGAEDKFFDSQKNGASILKTEFSRSVSRENISYYKESLNFEEINVDVLFSPGHSSDCVCLKIEKNLFCGDVVFANGIGRTDLIDSSDVDMIESLKNIKLTDFEIAYPGHYQSATKNQIDKIIEYYI